MLELKTIAIGMFFGIIIATVVISLVVIKAVFKFPSFRAKLWHGITDGDMEPSQEDFRKTAQLFFAFVFGFILSCCIFLWVAFPIQEWHYIVPSVVAVFLGCIGLRALNR